MYFGFCRVPTTSFKLGTCGPFALQAAGAELMNPCKLPPELKFDWKAELHWPMIVAALFGCPKATLPVVSEKLVTSGKLVVNRSRIVPGYRSENRPMPARITVFCPTGLQAKPKRG